MRSATTTTTTTSTPVMVWESGGNRSLDLNDSDQLVALVHLQDSFRLKGDVR